MKKALLIMTIILFSLGLTSCKSDNNVKPITKTIKVTDKTVKRTTSEGKDKYLIFTNIGTFEITDSLLNLRFDSADLYGSLQIGKCYKIKLDAFSFRSGFLSTYENIIDATKTDCSVNTTKNKQKNIVENKNVKQNKNIQLKNTNLIDCPLYGKTDKQTCEKFSLCLDNDVKRIDICKKVVK